MGLFPIDDNRILKSIEDGSCFMQMTLPHSFMPDLTSTVSLWLLSFVHLFNKIPTLHWLPKSPQQFSSRTHFTKIKRISENQ